MASSTTSRPSKRLPWLPIKDWNQRPGDMAIEESIPFRILVQLLASAGIIATDIAAGTSISLWAVPVSMIGGWWSWRQRHQRNIATKFWLAFGMLVALGVFLSKVISGGEDTRLILAQLLVQLQILHSFDLPRRRNLGYSMMIGLVLLGVAATLSQTLTFGGLLLVFLAIALPTLVLDYRGRLGMQPEPLRWTKRPMGVTWIDWVKFFVLVLAVGLFIFASLPRLPGYQLRNFPVSPTIEFEGEFQGSQISNPGYIRDGSDSGSGSGSGSGSRNATDNTGYYGFSNILDQRGGSVTPMQPKIVLRVRSQAPGFWRVLSFDRYTGSGWEVSRRDQIRYLDRNHWSYRFLLPTIVTQTKSKEVVQTYTVASELPNLVPVLPNAKSIYFPSRQIGLDPEDSIRSPITLTEDLTYTVISQVPYRNVERLQKAPTTYPERVQESYLQIPESLADQLKPLAESWLAKANSPITNPYDTAWYLGQYLKQHYSIQQDFPALEDGQDLTEAFLKQQGGYPDHFATVLSMMLRSVGIPSRVAVGFRSGQFNPFTGYYVVKNIDAQAITEVYIPENGWLNFNPVPGQELIPPSVEENPTLSALRQFWNWVAGWLPNPVRNGLSSIFESLFNGISKIIEWIFSLFTQGWLGKLIGTAALIGVGYLGWLLWQGWRRWRRWQWMRRLPPMEQLYQSHLATLHRQGHTKMAAQTPLEFAEEMQRVYPPILSQPIVAIAQAYVSWRYGNHSPNLEQLQLTLKQLQIQFKRRI